MGRGIYTGDYGRRSTALNAASRADPNTRCLAHCTCEALTITACRCGHACGRTLAQHPPTTTGRPPRWSSGHTRHGDRTAPIRPEVLGCNVAERNNRVLGLADQHTERW